jgi:hypothetical protein
MAKKKVEDSLLVVLDGKVLLVDVTKGKTTETELEGELVLRLLVRCLEDAVHNYVEHLELTDPPKPKKTKKPAKKRAKKTRNSEADDYDYPDNYDYT